MPSLNAWGITASEARAALKANEGRPVMVRTNRSGPAAHAGRAKMLEVINEDKALIRPLQGHKKDERVSLSSLKFWYSANVAQGIKMLTEPLVIPPLPTDASATKIERFYLVSKNLQSVFGGKNIGFTQNVHRAALYDKTQGGRAVVKVKVRPGAADAEMIPRDEALRLMGEWHGHQPAIPFIPEQTQVEPLKPVQIQSFDANMNIDIEAILEDGGLQEALTAQKKAAQEVRDAEQMVADARRALVLAHGTVVRLMSRFTPKAPTPAAKMPTSARRHNLKKGALKDAVMTVLTESSKLSVDAICDKVRSKLGIEDVDYNDNIKACLSAMKNDHLASPDENRNWSLMSLGRQAMARKG